MRIYAKRENPTRERDALAYKLVKAEERIDELERVNEKLSDEVNNSGPLLNEIRATLGPLSGMPDWKSCPLMVVVRGVGEKIGNTK